MFVLFVVKCFRGRKRERKKKRPSSFWPGGFESIYKVKWRQRIHFCKCAASKASKVLTVVQRGTEYSAPARYLSPGSVCLLGQRASAPRVMWPSQINSLLVLFFYFLSKHHFPHQAISTAFRLKSSKLHLDSNRSARNAHTCHFNVLLCIDVSSWFVLFLM